MPTGISVPVGLPGEQAKTSLTSVLSSRTFAASATSGNQPRSGEVTRFTTSAPFVSAETAYMP